jgi:hypothetical protein
MTALGAARCGLPGDMPVRRAAWAFSAESTEDIDRLVSSVDAVEQNHRPLRMPRAQRQDAPIRV